MLVGRAISAIDSYWMALLLWTLGPDIGSAFSKLNSSWLLWPIFAIPNLAMLVGSAAVYGWFAWRVADTRPWRITCTLLALAVFVFPAGTLASRYGYSRDVAIVIPAVVQGCTILLCEVWAAADDLHSRRLRVWTHWVGVGLSMMVHSLSVLWSAINWHH